jgi:hypothetical protein
MTVTDARTCSFSLAPVGPGAVIRRKREEWPVRTRCTGRCVHSHRCRVRHTIRLRGIRHA